MRAASLEFSNVLSVLLRQKVWVLLAGLVAAGAALSVQRSLPPRYTSQGALILAGQPPEIPELSLGSGVPSGGTEAVPTVIDTLRSAGFLASVASQLALAQAPDLVPRGPLSGVMGGVMARLAPLRGGVLRALGRAPAGAAPTAADANPDSDSVRAAEAVAYLQRQLKVTATDHSNLLSLQFTAASPRLAAGVINAVMQHYTAGDLAARQDQLSQVNQWLSQRARDLRAEVAADDAQIAAFLQSHDLGQVQGGSVAALQSSNAQADLAAARQTLARLQASLDTARQMAAHGVASASQEALASPLIQALRAREAELMQTISGLAAQNPERLRAEPALRAVRAQIATETDRILTGLARQTEIARSNVAMLEQSVQGAQRDARSTAAADAYYAQLTRDAEAKRQLYNAFLIRANETQLASAQFPTARILFAATPPVRPDAGGALLAVLLGFLAGSFAAITIILARHTLRDRVASTQDIAAATGLAVFGSLPEVRRRLIRSRAVPAPIDETLRAMWLAMRAMTTAMGTTAMGGGQTATEAGCPTVLVTSSEVGEGKTTVAAALAGRIAADGLRVMLIDADLRRPRLTSALSLRPAGRLEAVLTGAVRLEEALIADAATGLHCLLADGGSANPVKLLASPEFAALLANLRRSYDFVVLDSPPVLRVADAVLLSELAELTLFVVQCGRLPGDLVAEAIRRFPAARRGRMLALLTRVPASRLDQRDYYGGYGTRQPLPARIGGVPMSKPGLAKPGLAKPAMPNPERAA